MGARCERHRASVVSYRSVSPFSRTASVERLATLVASVSAAVQPPPRTSIVTPNGATGGGALGVWLQPDRSRATTAAPRVPVDMVCLPSLAPEG